MRRYNLVFGSVALITVFACGKKDSSDNSDEGDPDALQISNELGEAFPKDLAVASPYAAVKEIEGLNGQLQTGELAADDPARDYLGRKAETIAILNGKGDNPCFYQFPKNLSELNPFEDPQCYGPGIQARGFPDATSGGGPQPDQCTPSPENGPAFPEVSDFDNACLPTGDLGFWAKKEDENTACMAAKMNYEIERAGALVDFAMKSYAMLLCAADKSGSASLPDEGKSVDLSTAVSDVVTESFGGSFTQAKLSKEEGGAYLATLEMELGDGSKVSALIRQKVINKDSGESKGKMRLHTEPGSDGSKLLQDQQSGPEPQYISVNYDVRSDSDVRLEYRFTNGRGDNDNLDRFFDSKNNVKIPATDDIGQTQGFSWGILNLDGTKGTGKVAASWIAGNITENVRSFMAELSGERGELTGCGHFGFGVKLEDLDKDPASGWLDRMICNWAGPGHDGTRQGQELVQRQCLKETEGGTFAIESSNIFYVPRNSCGSSTSESYPNGTFEWRYDQPDKPTTWTEFDKVNDLIKISDLEKGTLDIPTRPEEL